MQYCPVNPCIPALRWGREHEDIARQQYVTSTKDQHCNFSVRMSGLVIKPGLPYLGVSPDGIISCDCCGKGVLEIIQVQRYIPNS